MRTCILILCVICSFNCQAQEHWEDEFWRKEAKEHFKNTGSVAGMYTVFYKNGLIKWQGKCLENGNPDSTWVYYTEDGNKIWEGEYNGKFYELKNSCDTLLTGQYKNGKRNGQWICYNHNGKTVGHYKDGEPVGIWQEFKEERVQTKLVKTKEYNYLTQTENAYRNDSVIVNTNHIDSLEYDHDELIGYRTDANYHEYGRFSVSGSMQLININPLNERYLQLGYQGLSSYNYSSGIEFGGLADAFCWSYTLNWRIANYSQVNDSIRLGMRGYSTFINFGGDLIKAKNIELVPSFGIGYQQLRLKVAKTNNEQKAQYSLNEPDFKIYTNPAPSLNAMLQLQFRIKHLFLCFSGGYVLDCSSNKWRYNGVYLNDAPKTSLSGFNAGASIGFTFY